MATTTARDNDVDLSAYMGEMGTAARAAAVAMARASSQQKEAALEAIAAAVSHAEGAILRANQRDLTAANDLDPALRERLELNSDRIAAMADGLRAVAALADPIGEITDLCYRPSGIQVGRMRAPLGVVGIIYESRPNVTADAAALCLKAGNAAILRGGSEALHSNQAIAQCVRAGLEAHGLPTAAVQVVATSDRAAVGAMLAMQDVIDVIVPRGGKSLVERVTCEARMPVIKHLDGVCHVYLDAAADLHKAKQIAINAKTQRYGVCNAMETLLVDTKIAAAILPDLLAQLHELGVEVRGCEHACAFHVAAKLASEDDWYAEYLAPILAIRVVDGCDAAIAHIRKYGSGHTDAIVTENLTIARHFLTAVDSSSVMVNASTRFADGFEYGLGAEVGISTDKFHARGPVGIEGLTNQKWIVIGDGHIRA